MSKRTHSQFIRIASEISPVLSEAIRAVGPVRMRRRGDDPLVDALFHSIVGQQLSTLAARAIWNRLAAAADSRSLVEYVATTDPDTIRSCGLSNAKVKSMKSIVAAHDAGLLDAAELARLDHAERSARLIQIWGVGQWTADMLGIFYFADPDVWPDGDLAVWRTLERLTSRRRKTVNTAARFAPRRSYLALYMWRIANTLPK